MLEAAGVDRSPTSTRWLRLVALEALPLEGTPSIRKAALAVRSLERRTPRIAVAVAPREAPTGLAVLEGLRPDLSRALAEGALLPSRAARQPGQLPMVAEPVQAALELLRPPRQRMRPARIG